MTAAATYQQAHGLAEAGRYHDAERLLRAGLAGAPADTALLVLLGFVLRMRREYPSAVQACDAAIRADPELADAHAERAESLIALLRTAAAISAALESTRLAPHDPAGHRVLARAYSAVRKAEPARSAARQALALAPDSVESLLTLAAVERDAGDREAAFDAACKALAQDPANTYGRWLVAMLDAERLKVGRSMRGLHGVARDDPAHPDVISMTWPIRSLLSGLRRWLAPAVLLVMIPAHLDWEFARLFGAAVALGVTGLAARVLIPAGTLPWRCLRLAPRLLRRAAIGGLVAVTAIVTLLVWYAVTAASPLPVLALGLVVVLWLLGFAERMGVRLDDPGFVWAMDDLRGDFRDFGADLREWWQTTKRELREAWNDPAKPK